MRIYFFLVLFQSFFSYPVFFPFGGPGATARLFKDPGTPNYKFKIILILSKIWLI